jgi:hypothetical protein
MTIATQYLAGRLEYHAHGLPETERDSAESQAWEETHAHSRKMDILAISTAVLGLARFWGGGCVYIGPIED